jgi:hypothetical protein
MIRKEKMILFISFLKTEKPSFEWLFKFISVFWLISSKDSFNFTSFCISSIEMFFLRLQLHRYTVFLRYFILKSNQITHCAVYSIIAFFSNIFIKTLVAAK